MKLRHLFLLAPLSLIHCAEAPSDDETPAMSEDELASMPKLQKIRQLSSAGESNELTSLKVKASAKGDLLPLYRGGFPRYEDLENLKGRGVKTVISLAGATGNEKRVRDAFLDARFAFAWLRDLFHGDISANPFASEPSNMSKVGLGKENFFDMPFVTSGIDTAAPVNTAVIDSILEKMADPESQPVYVHCVYGADRTSLIVGLYRLIHQDWEPARIVQEMKDHDFACKSYTAMNAIFDSYVKKQYDASCKAGRCDSRYDFKMPTDCRR